MWKDVSALFEGSDDENKSSSAWGSGWADKENVGNFQKNDTASWGANSWTDGTHNKTPVKGGDNSSNSGWDSLLSLM